MKVKTILFLLIACLQSYLSIAQTLPSKAGIISTMRIVNDHWQAKNVDPGNREWARSVYFTGNLDFYKIYPYEEYYDYTLGWANQHNWALSGGVYTVNADQQCAGQVYLDMYQLDEEKPEYKSIYTQVTLSNMIQRNVTNAWWWIDAMYMAMPSFTRLGVILDDTSYFNHMYKLYSNTKVERGLYNEEDGLWYRDQSFLPPYTTPNDSNSYWSRGNGWVFAAHVRVLQLLPESDPHYAEYVSTFQQMAEALRLRQREDGLWNVSLDDPNDFGGPEVSGTSFFTYGMAWGINNGFLDRSVYYPVVQKAWNGMTGIAVHDDGFLGYIQGVGVGPSSSQPVTYETTSDFGVGAFLLAGSELVKLAEGTIPSPPTFWLKKAETPDDRHVQVYFNKPVDPYTALQKCNYSISNGIRIRSVSLGPDSTSCILKTSRLSYGKYTVAVKNLLSSSGDSVYSARTGAFAYAGMRLIDYSSYQANTSNYPQNTLDMDLSTRWSAFGDGEWLLYDLGEVKVLDSVGIAFYSGDQRQTFLTLEVSVDGENFTSVFDGPSNGQTLGLEPFNTLGHVARYLKLTGHGNSQSGWNSVTEIRPYTSRPSAPTRILLSDNEVDESSPIGTGVGVLTSKDPDLGDAHNYALTNGRWFWDNRYFSIVGDSLVTNSVFDFESRSWYFIYIEATDLAGLSYGQPMWVKINDVAEDPSEGGHPCMTVYPVPIRDGHLLNIRTGDKNSYYYELTDYNGRIENRGEANNGSGSININGLKKGVYILKVFKGDEMVHSQRILKE